MSQALAALCGASPAISDEPLTEVEEACRDSPVADAVSLTLSTFENEFFPGERIPVTLTYCNEGTATVCVQGASGTGADGLAIRHGAPWARRDGKFQILWRE